MISIETDPDGRWLVLGTGNRTRLRPGWVVRPVGWETAAFFDAETTSAAVVDGWVTFKSGTVGARYDLTDVEVTAVVVDGDSYRMEHLP